MLCRRVRLISMAYTDAIWSSVALSPVKAWFGLAGVSGKLQCSALGALLKIRSIRCNDSAGKPAKVTVTSIKDGGVFFTISFRSGRLVGCVVRVCTRPGVTRVGVREHPV
ncbi:unnamed protein product, partial [Iphiclides podalirius]